MGRGIRQCSMIPVLPVQPVIAIERIVYHRERAAGMYAAMPYALAQGDVEIPYLLVQALLWSVITYWMFGFEASAGETNAFLAINSRRRCPCSAEHLLGACKYKMALGEASFAGRSHLTV